MERTIYGFVWRHSRAQTLIAVALTLAALPLYYVSLDIPKNIVNQAILKRGIEFPTDVFGISLDQIQYLFLLCLFFLVMVILNGGLKQYINSYKGRLGERLLRRLRYELLTRMLRFPLPHFRKVSAGELIPMVTSEVEPLGGFMGDAFAQPLIQAGTLFTIATFLFVQNWIMGLAAISLYPMQAYIIPKLQKRVNRLGKERVKAVRKLSERINETVAGMPEVRSAGTVNYERADFSERLGVIYRIRFEIFLRKSFVKFLNNFLNQMAPLLFYSIGGYLVIKGHLTVGALTAALAAQKDMSAPWKELLDFYQQFQDTKIKYDQVTEQFRLDDLLDERLQPEIVEAFPPLSGPIVAANLALSEDGQVKQLDGVGFRVEPGEKVAVIGVPGGGKEALAPLLGRLIFATGGKLTVGELDLGQIPEPVLGRALGYVAQNPYLFAGTVRDNLIYPLKQYPVGAGEQDDEETRRGRQHELEESLRAGNSQLDIQASWIAYELAGATDTSGLTAHLIRVLGTCDLDEDVYQLGLRGSIDPQSRPEIAAAILKARHELLLRLADPELAALVESFAADRYNQNATLAENLLFGTAVGPTFDADRLAENAYVLPILDRMGLTQELVEVGRQVAETMVELFADLPPGHEFFDQFSFISSEDLPEFQALLGRLPREPAEIKPADRARLLALPFKLIPARHRLDLLTDQLQARVLEARQAFRAGLPEGLAKAIEFFDPDAYNASATLQDNILFGKLAYGQAQAGARIGRVIAELLDELGLRRAVMEVGLDFPVGVGGTRLSMGLRQKLAIARALVKRPQILVVNEATAILDASAQTRIMDALFRECEGRTLIWVLHQPALAQRFDRVLVMVEGRLQEQGRFEELSQRESALSRLLAAS